ncbi:MAG: delta-60 repeat domain-containing protein [Desulfocapsaceae bacterium]|nr:delta-60 repeat domain-containing protein [Desulfocapsaceae bacterium]
MKRRFFKLFLSVLVSFSFLFHGHAVSAVVIDSSFGQDGFVKTKVGYYEDRAHAVVIQPDGKILVTGSSSNNSNLDFALVRYNPEGGLDNSFNLNGQVVTVVGNGDDEALGIALQDDGKIVTCGYTFNGHDRDIALLRFTANGDLDPDFGVNGMVTLSVGSGNDIAAAVAIQESGAILVSGSVEEGSRNVGALVRFLPNGSLDHSFGKAGIVLAEVGDNTEIAAMAIQNDGCIVMAGSYEEKELKKVLLLRFLADGFLDVGFGTGGIAETVDDTRTAIGKSLWVQEDGAILVAGSVGGEQNQDVALFRFTSDGKVDRDVGGGAGMLSYDLGGEDDVGYSVLATATTVFIAGYATVDGKHEQVLLQYPLTSGSQAELSVVTTEMEQLDGEVSALALQADAKLIAVGSSEESTISSFALVRYTGKELAAVKAVESGKESEFIATIDITEITRVGCFTGGEIKEGSGLSFTSRGVVYSIVPYPVLKTIAATTVTVSKSVTTTDTSTTDIAREGVTSDGTGVGRYGSILGNLTPGTHYYVRAYGVTSDNNVYYGNQLDFVTIDACFIATAAYGSFLDPHVQSLRLFRDKYLVTHEAGRLFVRFYYRYSPPIAAFIADQPVLRLLVRFFLFPVFLCSYIALHLGVPGMCMSIFALCGTVMFGFKMHYQKRWQ